MTCNGIVAVMEDESFRVTRIEKRSEPLAEAERIKIAGRGPEGKHKHLKKYVKENLG